MYKLKILISVVIFGFVLSACNSTNVSDPNKSVVVTPGLGQPTQAVDEIPSCDLVRGMAFINNADLFIMESFPVSVMLSVQGELPTPCNVFKADVTEPNDKNEIHIDVYSEVEEGAVCIQVIQPFDENISIPMAGQPDGTYTVWVNDEKVGEFSYPG